MSKEVSIVSGTKIKYKGVFDLSLLYEKLRDWLIVLGYSDPCEIEKKYSERVKPNGKSLEIIWEPSKEEEDGYFKLIIKISFLITGLNDVEIDKNGKNVNINKASIEIVFDSKLIINAKDSWDENKYIYKVYNKFSGLKDRAEEQKIELYKATTDLIGEVKNFLNLYRF